MIRCVGKKAAICDNEEGFSLCHPADMVNVCSYDFDNFQQMYLK